MTTVDLSDIQGNLIRGYNMEFVRHLVVRVHKPDAARRFLASTVSGSQSSPQVQDATSWDPNVKPASCLNVGITATGLRALGLDEHSLSTFPEEFRIGAAGRASKVGDVDGSAPTRWRDGFEDPDLVHLMWTIHAQTQHDLDEQTERLDFMWRRTGAFSVTSRLNGRQLPDKVTGAPCDDVHFGYRDSIAQPRFRVSFDGEEEIAGLEDCQPEVPIGSLLLGYEETSFVNVQWQKPLRKHDDQPDVFVGKNGCFNAFRVMEQDTATFERFLERESAKLGWNKEYLAAKLMGRWRNGIPIVLTDTDELRDRYRGPDATMPTFEQIGMTEEDLNRFDYPGEGQGGTAFEGAACPIGAHIRRGNPRSGRIVQRSANHTRQIVRRGIPYGPPFDPSKPDDGVARGLLGSFFCGSLIGQFEAMMYDWINLGLQDPRITGMNDPIIGANNVLTSRFEIPTGPDTSVEITGFPRFVETVGAAYLFCPSLSALHELSTL